MDNQRQSEVRAAAYLEAQQRLDLKGKGPKCNPPNRECGDRCIPPNWKCRVKGEGTDSHSRVVAGDPLAGAASIARGRTRLAKGLRTGNITEIQAGRAAIARGVVKAVPGKNLKEKQELRKKVEGVIIPVATGLFAAWALRQGHEAAKVLFPAYAKGPARDIENAAAVSVGFVLDRVPVYGTYRQAQRRNADLQAQLLSRAIRTGITRNPNVTANNAESFPNVMRQKVAGLRDALSQGLAVRQEGSNQVKGFQQFRSDLLSGVLGARANNQSLYAEPAAANFLARQWRIPREQILGSDDTTRKTFLIGRISTRLSEAAGSMRGDMAVRGLDYRKQEDVDRYINVVQSSARKQLRGISDDQFNESMSQFGGMVRELVTPQSRGIGPRKIATRLYDESVSAFDSYFTRSAQRIKEDTSPTLRVGVAQSAGSPIRSTLIGVAERVKTRVGITGPITGANHAELVIQKAYHEYSVPGMRYNPNRKATWTATDADIKYAAQDLGWDNQGGVSAAYGFLKRTGQFNNLAPRPRDRRAPRPLKSRSDLIATLIREGYSQAAAAAEADRRIAERGDRDDIPPRVFVYQSVLEKLRSDKACGQSFIPDNRKCTKATVAPSEAPKPASGPDTRVLVGTAAAALVLSGAAAASIDDVVRTRSRQFGEPSFSTYTDTFGEPSRFDSAKKTRLAAGAFGETSMVTVDGRQYVVKNPKQPSKTVRRAMASGLNDQATRNLYRAQGRITKSEVANARLAGELGVAPKVVAANRNTLVADVAKGVPAKSLAREDKLILHNTLARLHRAGIAHNDLKPDNMFIDKEAKSMQLIDFGLSMRSTSGVAQEWYRAMNPHSPNPLIGATGTATGSFNLRALNPKGYAGAEKALTKVIKGAVTEDNLSRAGRDPRTARQIQLVINNYYSGKYNT
jgi:hypothetical protein